MDADQPAHSVHTLTDVELRDYGRELEHSLKVISREAPVRGLLRRKLAEVQAEQEARSSAEAEGSAMTLGVAPVPWSRETWLVSAIM
jgi:hypothetical protein